MHSDNGCLPAQNGHVSQGAADILYLTGDFSGVVSSALLSDTIATVVAKLLRLLLNVPVLIQGMVLLVLLCEYQECHQRMDLAIV